MAPSFVVCFGVLHVVVARRVVQEHSETALSANSGNYVPPLERPGDFSCCKEYGIDQELNPLPDLGESAHEWCRADRVPEEFRIPPGLRGLYWLKGYGNLSALALCTSVGHWDAERKTGWFAPWSSFVEQRLWYDGLPPAIFYGMVGAATPPFDNVTGRIPDYNGSWPLPGTMVYEIEFESVPGEQSPGDPLPEASITLHGEGSENPRITSFMFNYLASLPFNEIEETPDGTVRREKPGDIFDRPSYALGLFKVHQYYAVRIVDDDGVVHRQRYEQMKREQLHRNGTFTACSCDLD